MKMKVLVPAAVLAATMGFAAPAFAQDAEAHVIGGVTVPEAEVEAVQARCDELRAAAGVEANTTNSPAGDGDPTTSADAADAADDPAAEPTIDLATLTILQCDEGGFAAPAAQ